MIAWLPQLLFFQDKNWALAGPEVVCLIINFCQFSCTGLESREQTGRGCKTTSLFVKEKRRRKGQVCFYRGGLGQLYPALPPATYFLGQNRRLHRCYGINSSKSRKKTQRANLEVFSPFCLLILSFHHPSHVPWGDAHTAVVYNISDGYIKLS